MSVGYLKPLVFEKVTHRDSFGLWRGWKVGSWTQGVGVEQNAQERESPKVCRF